MDDEAQPRKNYAILRFGKIRSWATLRLVEGHNTRKVESENLINDTPPRELLETGGDDFVLLAEERMEELGIPKPSARGKILAVEAVTSASRKWFETATDEEKEEWIARNLAWAREKFGRGLLSAKLHLDEEVWHIHFIATPVVEKAPKKRGAPFKDPEAKAASDALWATKAKRWTLAYEDLLGGHRMNLSREQDRYHAAVADLGLERGEKNPDVIEIELGDELTVALAEWEKGAPRKNIPPQEYRKIIKKLHKEAEAAVKRVKAREQELDQREARIAQGEAALADQKQEVERRRDRAEELEGDARAKAEQAEADRLAGQRDRKSAEAALARAREQEIENLRIRAELSKAEDDLLRREKEADEKARSTQDQIDVHGSQMEIIALALDPTSGVKLYHRDDQTQLEGLAHSKKKGVGASWDWLTGGIDAFAKRLTHLVDREAAVDAREREANAAARAASHSLAEAATAKAALGSDRIVLERERTQHRHQMEIIRKAVEPNGLRLEMDGAEVRGVGLSDDENEALRVGPSWFKTGLKRISAGLRSVAERTTALDRRQALIEQRERDARTKSDEAGRRLQILNDDQAKLDRAREAWARTFERAMKFITMWKAIPESDRSPNVAEAFKAAQELSHEELAWALAKRGKGGIET